MPRLPVSLASGAILALFAAGFGLDPAFAASPGGAAGGAPEQTTPQGKDPPGAEDGAVQTPPPAENKGVIPPPPTGDEGIHTDVPNPEAGHEEEVIPPSDLPGAEPNAEPK
jgi:hypothetical protein